MSSAKLSVPNFTRFYVHSPAVDEDECGRAYTSQRHYPHELLEMFERGNLRELLEYPGRTFYIHPEELGLQWPRLVCEGKAGCTFGGLIVGMLDLQAQMKKVSKQDARKMRPYNRVWKIKKEAVQARRHAVKSINEVERTFLEKRRAELEKEREKRHNAKGEVGEGVVMPNGDVVTLE